MILSFEGSVLSMLDLDCERFDLFDLDLDRDLLRFVLDDDLFDLECDLRSRERDLRERLRDLDRDLRDFEFDLCRCER